MIKLSIIVPIYGVEQYLRKCVDSILNQDIPSSEYEIILVDDGGHDKCPQICEDYAAAHENVRVVHRENGGLSAARNSGIEVAFGEYIMFVDSDDYIEQNVLGGLLAQVEREELDVLRYDYQNVNSKYEVFKPNKQPHKADQSSEIADGETYLNKRMGYACYAWQFIIKRCLIYNDASSMPNEPLHSMNRTNVLNVGCLFTEGIHFEDVDWLPRMMLKAKRVNSTTSVVYNYMHRQGSITKTQGNKDKIRKNIEDEMLIIGKYREHVDQYPHCQWLRNMQNSMVVGVLATVASELYSERKDYIFRLRTLNVYPLVIANQGKTYNRRAKLINLVGAKGYCLIMYIMTKLRAKEEKECSLIV